jgi:LPXTG-site transpeptidase (sortase) family protein
MKKTTKATITKYTKQAQKMSASLFAVIKTNVNKTVNKARKTAKSKKFTKSLPFTRYTVLLIAVLVGSVMQLNGLVGALQGEPKDKGVKAIETTVTPTHQAPNVNEPFVPERIIIEKAEIDLPIVSVPLENGTWQVNAGVANYAEGTSLVSSNDGNVGIFAHDRKDAFSNIKTLLTGSDIIVVGKNKRAKYKVHSASVIAPTAVNVFFPTEEPTLTLITCDGVFSEKRYMVKAKLVEIEVTH